VRPETRHSGELWEELGVEVAATGPLLFSLMDAGSPSVIEFIVTAMVGGQVVTEHGSDRLVSARRSGPLPAWPPTTANVTLALPVEEAQP
jgi:hypothetical protein